VSQTGQIMVAICFPASWTFVRTYVWARAAKLQPSTTRVPRGGHKKPKPSTEPELTGTETEYTETELTETNFGA
jgi:hypothetical protein